MSIEAKTLITPTGKRFQIFPDDEEKFFKMVNKNGPIPEHQPDLGRCWDYGVGAKNKNGELIRAVSVLKHAEFDFSRRRVKAYLVSFVIAKGTNTPGLFICHKCDRPCCVNPDHLFEGTQADNMRDKVIKGRHLRGEQAPAAKLTQLRVDMIRELHGDGIPASLLATVFSTTPANIHLIISGKNWKSGAMIGV